MALIMNGQERRTISVNGTEFVQKSGVVDLLRPGIYVLGNVTEAPLVSEVSPSLPLNMVIILGYNGGGSVTAKAPVTVTSLPGGQYETNAMVVSVPKGVSTFSFNIGTGIVTATISGKMINFQCNSNSGVLEYYLQSIYQES